MGNNHSFDKKIPRDIVSLIGKFIDIDTLITLYGLVDCSFFSDLQFTNNNDKKIIIDIVFKFFIFK